MSRHRVVLVRVLFLLLVLRRMLLLLLWPLLHRVIRRWVGRFQFVA